MVEPVSDSTFNQINWSIVVLSLLFLVIIVLIFGILELVTNITGREVINWQNVNAFMMIIFLVLFFALILYEYSIHAKYLLS